MSPLFMETVYEPNSPGSISAEDCNSHTAGSEREGEGQQVGKMGTKRREKNRDAARKSRRKQTERADELHEELQSIERSNSALQKEIATLNKQLHHYTMALKRHEPYCCLRESASSSSSSTRHSVSPSVGCGTSSSPPKVPPQASNSTLLASPSLSTSLNSCLGLQTLDCVKNPHLSPPTSAPTTTLASSPGSSAALFITSSSSSPGTVPCSHSFATLPAPHSLFSDEPGITSRPTNVMPASASLVLDAVPPSVLNVAAHPRSVQDTIHKTSSLSAGASCSAFISDTLDAFLTKPTSFVTSPSNVLPSYLHVATENVGLVQGCHQNAGLYSENPNNSSLPCSLLPRTQNAALQSFSASPQASLEPFLAPDFALKPSFSQQISPSPASLLSLLTVPSPLIVPQTTSNSFDGPTAQSSPSLPMLVDTSRDVSLSELLEVNDWILSGTNNQ